MTFTYSYFKQRWVRCHFLSFFLHRSVSGSRPSWTSALNTTEGGPLVWSHWAQGGLVFLECWPMAWARRCQWTASWEGCHHQAHFTCCRNRERVMRKTLKRSVAAQRAPIRRWGHLLLPAHHQHCTMETDMSDAWSLPPPLHAVMEPMCAWLFHISDAFPVHLLHPVSDLWLICLCVYIPALVCHLLTAYNDGWHQTSSNMMPEHLSYRLLVDCCFL